MSSTTYEVDEKTVLQAVLYGLAVRAPDGVYELTEKGNSWMRQWCDEQLAAHGDREKVFKGPDPKPIKKPKGGKKK